MAGLGLAAALLGELLWVRRISVRDGLLWVVDKTPPSDVVTHTVLEQLVAQPQHTTVRIWLDFLARDAADLVAQRLWRAGHVRREVSRRLLRADGVRWVPVDWNTAHWPTARLSIHLRDRARMTQTDVFLAGLVAATGLDEGLLQKAPASSHDYLRQVIAALPAPVRELVTHTEVAVGQAVLSYRT